VSGLQNWDWMKPGRRSSDHPQARLMPLIMDGWIKSKSKRAFERMLAGRMPRLRRARARSPARALCEVLFTGLRNVAGVESTHLAGKRGRFEFVNFGAKGSEKGRENRSGFLSPSTNVFFSFFWFLRIW
jgi:hypothetical protein